MRKETKEKEKLPPSVQRVLVFDPRRMILFVTCDLLVHIFLYPKSVNNSFHKPIKRGYYQ